MKVSKIVYIKDHRWHQGCFLFRFSLDTCITFGYEVQRNRPLCHIGWYEL